MITAVFTDNSDYARATGLWQWDYGQRLRIEGLKLPAAVEIHFALTEQSGDAITRVGTTQDGVTEVVIPDSLLENQAAGSTYEIYAWIYLADKTSGKTIKRISVQVKRRPKPEEHDTPEDAELFREAIEAVNASADRAETAREGAEAAQKAAEEAAGKIEGEITGAGQIAEQVKQNAAAVAKDKQAVSQMVTETTQNAQKAAEAAQAAERSSTAAKEAQTAAESAEAGAESAMEEVEGARTEVSKTHRLVEQLREAVDTDRQAVVADRRAVENTALQFGQAAQSAINAVGQAQEAAVGAVSAEGQRQTTAVQRAGTQAVSDVAEAKAEAIQAVTTEGDTQTKRVQDAAAGIVADREQIAANKQAIEDKVDKQQGADNAGKALVVGADGNVELGDAQTKTDPTLTQSGQAADAQVTGREITTLHQNKADAIIETAQGETMTLTDSSDKLFEGLKVFGKSTQDGTPSVENPVPIVNAGESGSIKVEVTGRNLLDGSKIVIGGLGGNNGMPFTATNRMRVENIKVEQGKTYSIDLDKSKYDIANSHVFDAKGNRLSGWNIKTPLPDNATSISLSFKKINDSECFESDVKYLADSVMFNEGVSAFPYEPYKTPQSLTLATPNGLLGVPVDKNGNYTDQNGQQWVCDERDYGRGKYVQRTIRIDLKSINKWKLGTALDGRKYFMSSEITHESKIPSNMVSGTISNIAVCGNPYTESGDVVWVYTQSATNYLRIGFKNQEINTVEKLKEYLSGMKEAYAQYAFATPIERDLTPEELAAYKALHTNYPTTVITNDAGAHMEASYVADTGTYIRNMEERLNAKLVNIQSALISQKISGGGIKVTDSSRVPVVRFTMWGKTEQRKTEGKNLIDIPEIKAGTGSIEVICNITRNAVFSCRKEDVVITKSIWRVQFKYKNGNSVYLTDDNISSGVIKVTEDNPIVSIVYRGMYIESGRYTDIQLEYGSSATAYEPYTGGKPSPSPDYPQPIEITDQPVSVTIKGGTEQQSITLIPPKPMTKWDKLEKVDGVWCWVYQHNEYTVTGGETFAVGGESYAKGSSTNCFAQILKDTTKKANGIMERLSAVDLVWTKVDATGFCLNADQLHMRLPNSLLGVSDDATVSEKIAAYKAYVKAEYDKGTPYHVIYETTVPEFIPLSPSEQAQLNALTMYAPETEVTNTGGCNMELTYTVDTKSYVDSKIAAISAAVLEV